MDADHFVLKRLKNGALEYLAVQQIFETITSLLCWITRVENTRV
jgi:ATP-dependent Lon protease